MANTCGFGIIKDGIFKTICINGTQIIDNKKNLKVRSVESNTLLVKKDAIFEGSVKGISNTTIYRGAVQFGLTGSPTSGNGSAFFAYESGGPQYAVALYTPIEDEELCGASFDWQTRINATVGNDEFTGGRLKIEIKEVANPSVTVAATKWFEPKTMIPIINVRATSDVSTLEGTLTSGTQYFTMIVFDNAIGTGFMTGALTICKK
jgi:hypothetical protein